MCRLDSCGWGQGLNGALVKTEPSGSIKDGEFLDQLGLIKADGQDIRQNKVYK
jgi:hypothetical protein